MELVLKQYNNYSALGKWRGLGPLEKEPEKQRRRTQNSWHSSQNSKQPLKEREAPNAEENLDAETTAA
eukprot:13471101-Ditylum_brightwellii.AAC.1